MNCFSQKLREFRGNVGSGITAAAITAAESSKASNDEARPTLITTAREDVDSGLERLPPEIRRHLLSVLDLGALKALTRASPAFHEQYVLDRRFLLRSSLEVTLGSVILDAYAVERSSDRASNTPDYLTGLLGTWRGQIEQRLSRQLDIAITEDEVIHVVTFYFRTIAPMATYFIRRALDELERQESEPEGRPWRPHPEPSSTEWQRCLRAAYRFQLLCQVGDPAMPAAVREDAIRNAIFVLFTPEPWEAEELISFLQFAQAAYEKVFDDIESEVHPDNPRFDGQDRPPTPEGAFDFRNPWSRRNFVEGTILHGGLGLLQTILLDNTPGDNKERLVLTMQRSIKSSYIPLWGFAGVLGFGRQAGQRQTAPSARDALMASRAPLPFHGENIDGPPLAWTVIWGGTYSNLIGAYVSDEMRRWAYVLWDAGRLEELGGRGVLERQWDEFWPHDPRDDLL